MTDNNDDKDQRMVFSIGAPEKEGDPPVLMVGFPQAAIDAMVNEKTSHNADLSSVGLPLKIIFYSEPTHDECMEVLKKMAEKTGIPLIDERDTTEFSIKENATDE